MDAADVVLQHDAASVWMIKEDEARPRVIEAGVVVREGVHVHGEEGGDGLRLVGGHENRAADAAAIPATAATEWWTVFRGGGVVTQF